MFQNDYFWFSNICKVPNCTRVRFGILHFLCGCGCESVCGGAAPQNREAIFGDAIAAPDFVRQRSRRPPPAQTKNSRSAKKCGTALILLSFQFYEVPYEINGNTHRDSKNDYFYYQMNRYIIVYAVA